MAHFRAYWAGILLLVALALGTQCVTTCAAADCAGTARQHSHCGKHRQPAAPEMPVHAICAYLPSGQAAGGTATAAGTNAFVLTPIATVVPEAVVRVDAAPVDTGPPKVEASSFFLVLKI